MNDTLLVVCLSSLGDVVYTIPAVRYLKELYPDDRIVWVVNRGYESLLRFLPFVDRAVAMAPKREGFKAALYQVKAEKPAVAYDFQGSLKSMLLIYLSGAKSRIGQIASGWRGLLGSLFLNKRVNPPALLHKVDERMALVSHEGVTGLSSFGLEIPRDEDQKARSLIGPLGIRGPYVALLPGACWPTKRWPVEHFAWLAGMLKRYYSIPSLVLWRPVDEEVIVPLRGDTRVKVTPLMSLGETMALLKRSLVVVGGDTGLLHLAAALGRPTLGLYGPSHAWREGPYGDHHLVLEVSCEERGCYRKRCSRACVASIPKEMVWDALKVILDEEMGR